MAYREFEKNSRESVRITPRRYEDYDLIDIRIFARSRQGDMVATKRGISINVDQVPELLDHLEWVLQQACHEDPEAIEDLPLTLDEVERLACETYKLLKEHGLAVHWDILETMVLGNPKLSRFNKWHLHYVLATRRDLFVKERTGCFGARRH